MREVVRLAFYDFNTPMEGAVPTFYQDVKGLVSIGVGILADPIHLALGLPMVKADGTPAGRDEIAAEWMAVKALGSGDISTGNPAAKYGWKFAKPHTRLRLTEEGLRDTLLGKLHLHDVHLRGRLPDFESLPADAQLALHSWAWGNGPASPYPKMFAALRARDFRAAAEEIRMVAYIDGKPVELHGLKPRNAANRALLINAAFVEELGLDPERLWWPRQLETDPLGPEDETEPTETPSARPDPLRATSFNRFDEALAADRQRLRDERDSEPPPPDDAA
jgi:GH24 family phage-related lysozyme (muramidase)